MILKLMFCVMEQRIFKLSLNIEGTTEKVYKFHTCHIK
jgi:hypothetical protein